MTRNDIKMLIEAEVEMHFSIQWNMEKHGFNVFILRGPQGIASTLTTDRIKHCPRTYKSLDSVYKLICEELNQEFTVESPL